MTMRTKRHQNSKARTKKQTTVQTVQRRTQTPWQKKNEEDTAQKVEGKPLSRSCRWISISQYLIRVAWGGCVCLRLWTMQCYPPWGRHRQSNTSHSHPRNTCGKDWTSLPSSIEDPAGLNH
mmetsp:Transcript_116483/g.202612  ORF Transcript_116483/g.202612 Transcript_116483/m.202612 type:complete len:121 (-) Transcript_116483:83-445(-)